MRKSLIVSGFIAVLAGTALAQIGGSASGVYLLDVDPARYSGPGGQRLAVRLGDEPRRVALGAQDEICVQLRTLEDQKGIAARVRALRPEAHEATDVRVGGPDISPGTFRSTPWGMLLRLVPQQSSAAQGSTPVGTIDAPVCSL